MYISKCYLLLFHIWLKKPTKYAPTKYTTWTLFHFENAIIPLNSRIIPLWEPKHFINLCTLTAIFLGCSFTAIWNQRYKLSEASFYCLPYFDEKLFLSWIACVYSWAINSLTEKLHGKQCFPIFHTGCVIDNLLAHWDKLGSRH